MKIVSFAVMTLTACLIGGAAFAQATTPAPAKPAPAPVVRSAQSIECSKQADAKGLHGKERKKFERDCKKTAAK